MKKLTRKAFEACMGDYDGTVEELAIEGKGFYVITGTFVAETQKRWNEFTTANGWRRKLVEEEIGDCMYVLRNQDGTYSIVNLTRVQKEINASE